MVHALYFKSRKNFSDKSTWTKELMPSDYTREEVAEAARLAGMEGYAIVKDFGTSNVKTLHIGWFVRP